MPTELHEWVVAYVVGLLLQWSFEHGGRPLASGYKVRIDDQSESWVEIVLMDGQVGWVPVGAVEEI